MLKITIPPGEQYDEVNNLFIVSKEQPLQLEHSLVSLSKWESKWCKPFLSKEEKSIEETLDYIRCMTVTQNVDPKAYAFLTDKNIDEINAYIDAPMTATTFSQQKGPINKSVITAEIIYYWMVTFNIPFECQKWHLNRLLTLINVCSIKSQTPKKMSAKERRNLNAARRKAHKTRG